MHFSKPLSQRQVLNIVTRDTWRHINFPYNVLLLGELQYCIAHY